MDLRITLAPDGGLRLILPEGRTLDVGDGPRSMQFIKRILEDGAKGDQEKRGYIREYPTQHILDIWRRGDTVDAEELRQVLERKRAEAQEAKKEAFKERGIDLEGLDIRL